MLRLPWVTNYATRRRALSIGDSCGRRRLQDRRGQSLRRPDTRRARSISLVVEEKPGSTFRATGRGILRAAARERTEGYFADPLYGGNRNMAAWKWIGFPGARADFTDWIDQAGHKYPTDLSPSAEQGLMAQKKRADPSSSVTAGPAPSWPRRSPTPVCPSSRSSAAQRATPHRISNTRASLMS